DFSKASDTFLLSVTENADRVTLPALIAFHTGRVAVKITRWLQLVRLMLKPQAVKQYQYQLPPLLSGLSLTVML
ncbi:hypothetical protein ACP3WD_23990, partial [Salmonella enterica]|uniref:hypothetical protein n=1 Tax=Salmonella enterica TaxID=28901 RepID=UPI003CF00D4E